MHAPKELSGNLCMLEDLFVSNKERLSRSVCMAVAKSLVGKPGGEHPSRTEKLPRVQYKEVAIPGDGRCGWRAIIAANNPAIYQSVPRTGWFTAVGLSVQHSK